MGWGGRGGLEQIALGQKNLNQNQLSFNRPSAEIFSSKDSQGQSFSWPSAKRISIRINCFNRPSAEIFSAKDSQGQTKFQLAFGQKNLNQRKLSFNRPSAEIFSAKDSQGQTKFQLAFGQKNLNQRKLSFNRPSAEIFSAKDSQGQLNTLHNPNHHPIFPFYFIKIFELKDF